MRLNSRLQNSSEGSTDKAVCSCTDRDMKRMMYKTCNFLCFINNPTILHIKSGLVNGAICTCVTWKYHCFSLTTRTHSFLTIRFLFTASRSFSAHFTWTWVMRTVKAKHFYLLLFKTDTNVTFQLTVFILQHIYCPVQHLVNPADATCPAQTTLAGDKEKIFSGINQTETWLCACLKLNGCWQPLQMYSYARFVMDFLPPSG